MKILRAPSLVLVALALFCTLAGPSPASAQQLAYQEDFEDGQAQDWTLEPGWQVIQVDGNQVLSGSGHQWARFAKTYDDYRLSFRIMLVQADIHLNYRMNNTGRYFINFNNGGSRLSKQYWPDSFENNLAAGSQPHQGNVWHQVEISGSGDQVTFTVDGKVEWTYTDPDPLLEGSFAFESLDNSQVYIDDIQVELAATSEYIIDETAASLTWVRTGGPLGGLGYDIRMMPGNPDQLLVSDAWAGVFASTDGGATWSPSNTGITVRTGPTGDAIPIFCLTIDPTHPEVVWVGTQILRGLFQSTDGGVTWVEKDQGVVERDGITFRGISVDPSDSNIVYAAAELASWTDGRPEQRGREFDMVSGVVYKTIDGGETWSAVWRGSNLARYILIDPRDPNVLYVSTGLFDREAANSDPQTGDPGGEGILKSTDGGQTWTHINNGLDNLYVGTLFMHPTNPDILIAGTGNVQYSSGAGVYLTTDGGATWTRTLPMQNGQINSVEISTSNPNIVYAASNAEFFRSEDGGYTWTAVSGDSDNGWGPAGVRAGFPIDLQVDPRNPDRIFANEYGGGNFLSEDGGRTWLNASQGYTGAQVRAVAVDPNQPGHVIAAARSGIFVSYDGGDLWAGLSYPPVASMEWNAVALDPSDPGHILSETNWGNYLVASFSSGLEWSQVYALNDQRVGWHAIAFAPSNPGIVYAGSTGYYSAGSFDSSQGGSGIYVSSDGGATWVPANNTLSRDASVYGLAVDSQDPNLVYAATSNHGLLRTTDGGANWETLQGGLPQSGALSVAVSPAESGILLAGFERQAIYRSLDGGLSWEAVGRGMNHEARITSIVFDPGDPEVIYAADWSSGVYRSSNGGSNWTLINNGLFVRAVNGLAISGDGQHLYAGTEGGGVYRLDLNHQPPQEALVPTAVPSPTPVSSATGTPPAPEAQPGVCGASALLPLAFLGLAWLMRRR